MKDNIWRDLDDLNLRKLHSALSRLDLNGTFSAGNGKVHSGNRETGEPGIYTVRNDTEV